MSEEENDVQEREPINRNVGAIKPPPEGTYTLRGLWSLRALGASEPGRL